MAALSLVVGVLSSIVKVLTTEKITIGILLEEGLTRGNFALHSPDHHVCSKGYLQLSKANLVVGKFHKRNITDIHLKVRYLMKRRSSAVISFATCETEHLLHAYLQAESLPHLPVPLTYCANSASAHGKSRFRMRRRGIGLVRAVIDFVKSQEWSEVHIFTDGTFTHQQFGLFVEEIAKRRVASVIHQVDYSTGSFSRQLGGYRKTYSRTCFVLLLNGAGAIELLKAAKKLNLLTFNRFWLIGNLNTPLETLQQMDIDGRESNIILFKRLCFPSVITVDKGQNGFKITVTEGYLLDIVNRYLYKCLDLREIDDMTSTSLEEVEHLIPELSPSPPPTLQEERPMIENKKNASGIAVLLHPDSYADARYNIFSIIKCQSGLVEKLVGEWSKEKGLVSFQQAFPNAKPGLGEITLRVGTNVMDPYVMKTVTGKNVVFRGLCIDILDELSKMLNFHYVLVESRDQTWGPNLDNGSWGGLVGMTMKQEVLLSVGPFSLNAKRNTVIDFTKPFTEDGLGILLKRPSKDNFNLFQIFRPFTNEVWGILIIVIIVTALFLSIINKISFLIWAHDTDSKKIQNQSFMENLWMIYGYCLEQECGIEPANASGRAVISFWWLSTILLVTSYTANLTAFLTIYIDNFPFRSLADLASQSQVKPICIYGTSTHMMFQQMSSGVYGEIWQQMKNGPLITSFEEVTEMVLEGSYALIADLSVVRYIAAKNCETLYYVKEDTYQLGLSFIVPLESPLLETISYSIMRIQEAGLITKWQQVWWRANDSCSVVEQKKTLQAKELSMMNVSGPFLIYASCAAGGILCMVVSYFLARRRKKTSLVVHSSQAEPVSLRAFNRADSF